MSTSIAFQLVATWHELQVNVSQSLKSFYYKKCIYLSTRNPRKIFQQACTLIQRYKKSWIMLENTKKILHIRTVKQRRRKNIYGTKNMNLYTFHYWCAWCPVDIFSGGTCPRPLNIVFPLHLFTWLESFQNLQLNQPLWSPLLSSHLY